MLRSAATLFIQLTRSLLGCWAHGNTMKLSPCGNKLPHEIHQKVYMRQKKRIIVMGDIHGCYDEFQELLEKCNFNQSLDQLVSVGDLVSKGPKSTQVLRTCRELGALMVRGNHDDSILAVYYNTETKSQQKIQLAQKLSIEDVKYLEESPFTLSFPEMGIIIVHAGIVPGISLHKQNMQDMYTMRNISCKNIQFGGLHSQNNFYQYGTVTDNNKLDFQTNLKSSTNKTPKVLTAEQQNNVGSSWASFWKGPDHIIFGHDAKRELQLGEFFTGLDGGCCYGKKLFALVFDCCQLDENVLKNGVRRDDLNAKIISVDSRKVYEVPQG